MYEFKYEVVHENDNIPCLFRAPENGHNAHKVSAHIHDYLEILFMKNDHIRAIISAKEYQADKGDFLIISPEEIHMTEMYESTESYVMIQISRKRLSSMIPDIEKYHFMTLVQKKEKGEPGYEYYDTIRNMMLHMESLLKTKPEHYELLFSAELDLFLYQLLKNFTVSVEESGEDLKNRDTARISNLMNWTKLNYMHPLSLSDAASYMHLSREYLCRIFKKYTGQTYLDYLNRIRMESFYDDLLHTDKSIRMLCEENGISNEKTFRKEFRKNYGVTPLKSRQKAVLHLK